MSNVPRMTMVMPLRCRIEFTSNALPSFLKHATRADHEIVIVLDKCPIEYEIQRRPDQFPEPHSMHIEGDRRGRERVYRWIDAHQAALSEHGVRVIETYGEPAHWTGGQRSARALNEGVEAASTDWIIGIGDEDLVFMNGWDMALWNALDGRDPMKTVATPTMVMPRAYGHLPTPLSSAWVHEQRLLCKHQLSFPMLGHYAHDASSARIGYDTLGEFCKTAALGGVHEERCGERVMCHWVPMLMHRDLLRSVGRWPTDDARAFSYDIGLDDELGKRGVQKRMPLDHFILHSKHHVFIDNTTVKLWGEAEMIERLSTRPIL